MSKKSDKIGISVVVALVVLMIIGGLWALKSEAEYQRGKTYGCVDERTPTDVQYRVTNSQIDNYYIAFTDGTAQTFSHYTGPAPVVGQPFCLAKGWK